MATDFKKLITENFGENLTARQLWALTLFAKNVRLRCRNNTAFNNFMNATFPHARFRQVQKSRISRITGQPESYPGLEITIPGTGETAGNTEESEE